MFEIPGVMAYGDTAQKALVKAEALALRVFAERLENEECNAMPIHITLNNLMFELSTQILAEEEAKQRFLAAQLRGNPKRALQLLANLDGLGL